VKIEEIVVDPEEKMLVGAEESGEEMREEWTHEVTIRGYDDKEELVSND